MRSGRNAPFVVGHVGADDHFHPVRGVGLGVVHDHVHAAAAGRRGAGIVDEQLVAADLAADPNGDGLVEPVRRHGVGIDTGAQGADGLAHGALGTDDDLVGQRFQPCHAELVHELQQTRATHRAPRDLSMEVAQHHLGQAHVGADESHERLVGPSPFVELHDGDLQPLLVDLTCLGRQHVAADVGRVARRRKEGHAVVPAEDRRADGDVIEMPGRLPGIVGDEDVTGLEGFERVGTQKVSHGERHGVDVARGSRHRLGDHVAAPVEDTGREVPGLPDNRGEGRTLQGGGLLVDDADETAPADLERDGIHHDASTATQIITRQAPPRRERDPHQRGTGPRAR